MRDVLTMEVELPKNEWSADLVPRFLVFDEAYGYQVFEGPFQGCPTILELRVVGEQGRWSAAAPRHQRWTPRGVLHESQNA